MTKPTKLKGSLEQRIDDLVAALSAERVDEKLLRDLVSDAFGRDLLGSNANRFRFDWRGKENLFNIIQRPAVGSLNPEPSQSVDFDNARHGGWVPRSVVDVPNEVFDAWAATWMLT